MTIAAEGGDAVAIESTVEETVEAEPIEANGDEGVVEGTESEPFVDDERYVITVDGEEQEVSLDELLSGYQRQADYTRKTQSLASEREQLSTMRSLEAALAKDPAAALAALAEAYGIQSSTDNHSLDDMDPLEARMVGIERMLTSDFEAKQVAARQAAIETEANAAIESQNLENVSAGQLLAFATQRQIGDLNTAALLMSVTAEKATEKKATIRRVTTEKRQANVVEGGRQRGQEATKPARATSIREAWAQAKTQHGID